MHSRIPNRRRQPPGSSPARQGETVPIQGETQEPVPRMPHERDESSDSQATMEPSAQRIGKVAHDDVAEGQVDTGKGPAMDETYHHVREGAKKPAKRS